MSAKDAMYLFAKLQAEAEAADLNEATGLCILVGDPESGKRFVHGPFPKDGAAAFTRADEMATMLNADNADRPFIVEILLLFAP